MMTKIRKIIDFFSLTIVNWKQYVCMYVKWEWMWWEFVYFSDFDTKNIIYSISILVERKKERKKERKTN